MSSFSQDIRSSGNFQELFGKLRRRINKNEVSKDDLATLQRHVNNMRTQIDWASAYHITDNLASNPEGPNDAVFEPDLTEVIMYQPFANILGSGIKNTVTLNGTNYDIIDIGEGSLINVNTVTPTSSAYHFEPYQTFDDIGGGDAISVAEPTAPDLTPPFSLSIWFRTSYDAGAGFEYMVHKGSFASGTINFALIISTDVPSADGKHTGEIIFSIGAGTTWGAAAWNANNTGVNDGEWHNLVGTYAGSDLSIYLDGNHFFTNDTGGATPPTNNSDLIIGGNATVPFIGDLDELYIWDVELTPSEISDLYTTGIVPQQGNIVYSNLFGGSGGAANGKICYYAVPQGAANWDWNVGFHPPSMKNENSISLNVGSNSGQFVYYDEFGTDFDFTSNNFSMGFWIYPTDLTPSGTARIVAARRIDANNKWTLAIADADQKLFEVMTVGGSDTKRQYDTALTANNWYYINKTWEFGGPTLSLKVNDNADTSSTKTEPSTTGLSSTLLCFGNTPGNATTRDFKGYMAFPMYYKHSTVLTSGERTSLYNYNTKTSTTEPAIGGFAQAG